MAAAVPLGLALRGGGAGLVERQQFTVGIWVVLLAGFLFGVLPRTTLPRGAKLPIAAAIALVGWTALGLLWTDSVERTIAELARLAGYLGIATLMLSTLHGRTWRAAAAGLLSGAAVICMLALASRLAPDLVDWGASSELGLERLNYPLEYWNALAFVAAATALLGLGLGCYGDASVRPLAVAVTPLAGLVLYLTLSRGGVIAVLAGALTLVLLASDRRRLIVPTATCVVSTGLLIMLVRSHRELAEGSGGEGGAIVALGALAAAVGCGWSARAARSVGWSARRPPSPRPAKYLLVGAIALAIASLIAAGTALSGAEGSAGSGAALSPERAAVDPATRLVSTDSPRYELWRSAVSGLAEDPLLGSGAGTFSYRWDGEGRGDDLVVDSHSLFLDALAETGIPGTVALVGALVGLLVIALRARGAARRRRDQGVLAALVAVFVAFCLHAGVDWLWEVPAAGVLGLSSALIATSAGSRPRRAGRWGALPTTLAVATCLGAVAVQVPGLVSEDRIESSRDASRAGQDKLAVELATDAIAGAPWFASPYAQRAEVELASERFAAATADAEDAAEREPLEWRHSMLLARILLAAGDESGAIESLDRVAQLRPASRPLVAELQEQVRSGDRTVLDPFDPS